jgi:hypothetical protein
MDIVDKFSIFERSSQESDLRYCINNINMKYEDIKYDMDKNEVNMRIKIMIIIILILMRKKKPSDDEPLDLNQKI